MRLKAGTGRTWVPGSTGPARGRSVVGFTILELVAVFAVMAVLTFLAFPNFATFRRKIDEVRCSANMRSIAVGLRGYLLDHGNVWPQGPPPAAGSAWENFWISTLQPYGITPATWRCPTVSAGGGTENAAVHYTPTMFPPIPGIADRWATQPWLIERGEGHGQGALICFPDGSIKSFDKVLAEQGVR